VVVEPGRQLSALAIRNAGLVADYQEMVTVLLEQRG
jgi:hypothetical protein